MKLKISEFEAFAQKNGKSANTMLRKLSGGAFAHAELKSGNALGYELAKNMYNILGERLFLSLVDLEEETIDGFKSKFIGIGNKLY